MTVLTFINKTFIELLLILNFVNVDNIIVRTFEADIIVNVDIQVTFFTKYSIKYKVNFHKWLKYETLWHHDRGLPRPSSNPGVSRIIS